LYGVESNLRLDRIREVSERVRELSGYELEPWKPLTGDTLYRRESGAVASQFHDPESIEPYSSELVGAERAIVLGKKSGLDSSRIKADELGLDVPEARRGACRGEGARRAEARTRHRRRVPGDRRWLAVVSTTRSSSARASTASPVRRCSPRPAGTCVCLSATTGSAARSRPPS